MRRRKNGLVKSKGQRRLKIDLVFTPPSKPSFVSNRMSKLVVNYFKDQTDWRKLQFMLLGYAYNTKNLNDVCKGKIIDPENVPIDDILENPQIGELIRKRLDAKLQKYMTFRKVQHTPNWYNKGQQLLENWYEKGPTKKDRAFKDSYDQSVLNGSFKLKRGRRKKKKRGGSRGDKGRTQIKIKRKVRKKESIIEVRRDGGYFGKRRKRIFRSRSSIDLSVAQEEDENESGKVVKIIQDSGGNISITKKAPDVNIRITRSARRGNERKKLKRRRSGITHGDYSFSIVQNYTPIKKRAVRINHRKSLLNIISNDFEYNPFTPTERSTNCNINCVKFIVVPASNSNKDIQAMVDIMDDGLMNMSKKDIQTLIKIENIGIVCKHKEDDTVVGGLLFRNYVLYIELLLMAVKPKYRGFGIGAMLIDCLKSLVPKTTQSIFVKSDIYCVRFYKKNGFVGDVNIPSYFLNSFVFNTTQSIAMECRRNDKGVFETYQMLKKRRRFLFDIMRNLNKNRHDDESGLKKVSFY